MVGLFVNMVYFDFPIFIYLDKNSSKNTILLFLFGVIGGGKGVGGRVLGAGALWGLNKSPFLKRLFK